MITAKDFSKKPTVIPYLTFGDPSPEMSETLIETCFDAGVSMVEVGIPFSDPIADGPVIQASHMRALHSGQPCNIKAAFKSIVRLKKKYPANKIIFMMSCNLIEAFGIEALFSEAAIARLDGVVIPDLPVEAAQDYLKQAKKQKIDLIFLVSPLCEETRLQKLVRHASGFVYLVSSSGITGVREQLSTSLPELVARIKAVKDIPVAIGFGISTPAHVQTVSTYADAAIVGSHLVKVVEAFSTQPDVLCRHYAQTLTDLMA